MAVQKSILEDKTITQAKPQYSSTVVLARLHWAVYNFLKEIFASALFSVSRLDHNTRICIPYSLQEVHLVLKLSLQTSTEEIHETQDRKRMQDFCSFGEKHIN